MCYRTYIFDILAGIDGVRGGRDRRMRSTCQSIIEYSTGSCFRAVSALKVGKLSTTLCNPNGFGAMKRDCESMSHGAVTKAGSNPRITERPLFCLFIYSRIYCKISRSQFGELLLLICSFESPRSLFEAWTYHAQLRPTFTVYANIQRLAAHRKSSRVSFLFFLWTVG